MPSSLPGGKKALHTLWDKYRDLPFESPTLAGSKLRRSPSPSDFERSTNMALIYGEEDEEDQLVVWIRKRPFNIYENDTLLSYWLRQLKIKSTHRLARTG
jgi:hypothetical protein